MNTNKQYMTRTLWLASILLTGIITGCNRSDNEDNTPAPVIIDSSVLTMIATSPAENDKAVPLNHKVIATFSEAIDGTTVDAQSFSVKGADQQALSGSISVDNVSHTAIFTPASDFTADTVYTATLTTAIKSSADSIALADDYTWQFTSGTATDTSSPTVNSTTPADAATGVLLNRAVTANFSEQLDPATVNAVTFTLSAGSTEVSGVVSYGGTVATLTPSSDLAADTEYTATLTTGITDLAANSLAATEVWSFTTGSAVAKGPAPVNLGSAGDFAILTKTGITNIPYSTITGNIGASPITANAIKPACSEVIGLIYGADAAYAEPTCVQFKGTAPDNTLVANAVLDMGLAYTDAAGRTTPDFTELHAGDLSGKTLVPGLYKWGTNVLINTDVTLSGGENDVWIFQVANNVTLASAKSVILEGGALAKNVFWQVGGGVGVALGTNSTFNGIVLAEKGITVNTGATVNGRLLSQTAVTLDQNTVTQPAL